MLVNFFIIVISLVLSTLVSIILFPVLERFNCHQSVSRSIERHLKKDQTKTMGGIIFVVPYLLLSIYFKVNILLIIQPILYSLLGFYDDYMKVKEKNNEGLSITIKFILELIIALIFYFIYLINGYSNNFCLNHYCFDIGFIYGIWVLFFFCLFTNAVNITDGLDGLVGGLSIILLWGFTFIIRDVTSIIILISGLIIFMFYNHYPAKIFMGDLGSLFLGAYFASLSLILKKESFLIIGGMLFILELLSSFLQIISIKLFNRKIFLKAPLHHHFEEKNYPEKKIVSLFYLIGVIFLIISLIIELLF